MQKNVQANVWPYHWDEEEASKIVDWFSMLRHSKGDLAGQPISLTIWQKFNLCQLYGWREDITGYKGSNSLLLRLEGKMPSLRWRLV